jgi:predicted KAP-like P-loop ATPase
MPWLILDWNEDMFKPDLPITKRGDDLLGRAPFCQAFGKALLEYAYKESIVTALYGDWGSGKSSIVNMAREFIQEQSEELDDDKKPVLLEFNPWNHSDQSHLISQFFKVLSGALKRQDYGGQASEIGKKLEAYSHFFSPLAMIPDPSGLGVGTAIAAKIGLGAVGKAASAWGAAYSKDLQQVREELNGLLAAESRKIIIVIDDIDRLPDIEVRQIFQLVKMLGDFPNTIYVLSFDKEVVSQALNVVQHDKGEAYLEKSFNFPLRCRQLVEPSWKSCCLLSWMRSFMTFLRAAGISPTGRMYTRKE